MSKSFDKSRLKLLMALGVLLAALWLVVASAAYQESQLVKYDVCIKPGAVNYGTRSTVVMPAVTSGVHSSGVRMVSSTAVHAYAHYGHSAYRSSGSGAGGYRLHTTSSATVHSIGSSGGAGGGMSGGSSSGSSRGINYTGGFSVPTLALVAPVRSTATESTFAAPTRRKVIDNGDGTYTGEYNGEYYNGEYWNEEEEEWQATAPVGTVKEEGGYYWEWNGTTWVQKGQIPDLGTPVGDIPWWLMLVLLLAYGVAKKVGFRRNNG